MQYRFGLFFNHAAELWELDPANLVPSVADSCSLKMFLGDFKFVTLENKTKSKSFAKIGGEVPVSPPEIFHELILGNFPYKSLP